MNNNVVINIENFTVSYDTNIVLENISCQIKDGEFVAIIGKSGCGKSTFLNALAGFIESQGIRKVPSEIGIVFQNYDVFPWLTVQENIAFGLEKMSNEKKEATVFHYLELVGLTEHANKYPAQLSGGQKQRVALGRALAPNPSVIFMDEPFGALDIFTRDKMQEWLNSIWEKENKTVIFVTHNIEEAIFLSDKVMVFGKKNIIEKIACPFDRPRKSDIKFTSEFIALKQEITNKFEKF